MILAIDIGGTTSKLGIVADGSILARARIDTSGHTNEHDFVDRLIAVAAELTDETGGKITSVGIGAPNGNQLTGTIEKAPNLPWAYDIPLARMISERMNVPATLGNDANAAAMGEWRFGSGKGHDNLLVVTLGTGLGSGFIVNGALVLGSAGNAGELGHMIVLPGGRKCTCGRAGCLEAYVSIRGIKQTYEEIRMARNKGPVTIEIPALAEEARRAGPDAIETFERTAEWLAIGLANAVCTTGPDRIILFGGLARTSDLLMPPLERYFTSNLLTVYQGRVDIVLSGSPEDDAALLGAAALTTLQVGPGKG